MKSQPINPAKLALFFRQFSTLISANIPIVQACDMIESSQDTNGVRLFIQDIKRELLAGKTLSIIFNQQTNHFNAFICHLVRIGEQTGKLDVMLLTIADHLEKKRALTRKIKQALFYPCIILCTGISLVICMFIFVIPTFAELFAESNTPLPILTSALFYIAAHFASLLGILFIIICILIFFIKRKHNLRFITFLMQTFPLSNKCQEKIILAHFARDLAIMFDAGIPIIDALRLTMHSDACTPFNNIIQQVIIHIHAGIQLHRALAIHKTFPPLMVQMIKIGEQSGKLVFMLEKISAFLEADIEQLFARLTQLLEPLIMLVLGALIGLIVVGMYLPIFKLGSTL